MPNSRPPSIDKPRSGSGDAAAGSLVGMMRSGSAGRQVYGSEDATGKGSLKATGGDGSYTLDSDAGALAQRGHELGLEAATTSTSAAARTPVTKGASPVKSPSVVAKVRESSKVARTS